MILYMSVRNPSMPVNSVRYQEKLGDSPLGEMDAITLSKTVDDVVNGLSRAHGRFRTAVCPANHQNKTNGPDQKQTKNP